jgi:lipoprotein-releasing system ATP-binding protein
MKDSLEQMLSEVAAARPSAAGRPVHAGTWPRGHLLQDNGLRLDQPRLDQPPLEELPLEEPPVDLRLEEPPRENARAASPAAPSLGQAMLAAVDLHKSYRKGPISVPVLRGANLTVREGEFLAIVGQSGSGKSTLLHLLGTLDGPDQGEVHFHGRRIDNLPSSGRDALRNREFGMIFQFYYLLPELTTLENVLAPLMITHSTWGFLRRRREYRAAATEILQTVGLGHRLKHRPRELSGGEMQRAAIARALVARPSLLLADEPTGNLDQETGREIIKILCDLNRRQNLTIVMVTHDPAIAAQADRTVRLVSGRIARPDQNA